jgi:hypothetical protein
MGNHGLQEPRPPLTLIKASLKQHSCTKKNVIITFDIIYKKMSQKTLHTGNSDARNVGQHSHASSKHGVGASVTGISPYIHKIKTASMYSQITLLKKLHTRKSVVGEGFYQIKL